MLSAQIHEIYYIQPTPTWLIFGNFESPRVVLLLTLVVSKLPISHPVIHQHLSSVRNLNGK